MAPSGGDPYRSPPIIRKRTTFPLAVLLRKLFGLLTTVLFVIVIFGCIPVYLALGIIGFVKRKSRRWKYVNGCCSHQWPISGTGPDLAGIVVTGCIDMSTVNDAIQRVVADRRSNLHQNAESDITANLGKVWDHSSFHVATDTDVLTLQQQENALPTDSTTLSLVTDFAHSLKSLTNSSLVMTSTATNCAYICVQRLLSICLNERTSFEIEPHTPMRNGWQLQTSTCFPQSAVCTTVNFVLGGPLSLLRLALRGQQPVWKHLESKEPVPAKNRRRLKFLIHRDSASVLMDPIPDDSTPDMKSPAHAHRNSLLRNVPHAAHRRCWTSVLHPELLLRAEKLLRSSTAELCLALLAGALRNYFREQGILHPPDMECVTPCTSRGCPPIGERCDTSLLPFQLPTSVEGAIPRLWAVQRNITKAMDGSTSSAVTIVQWIARACLPASMAKHAFRVIYRSHAIYFAFYRENASRMNANAEIQTMFIFPSLASSVRAAFVFIQHGNGIDLSVSLCTRTFPDPEKVLHSFQHETRLLLDHLSLRLLSLPQTTVLPGVALSLRHEKTENEVDSEVFGSPYLSRGMAEEALDQTEHEYSLEELYQLLDVVQTELDSMRSNPEMGMRSSYIERLTRLEEKMQNFHECISQKLSADKVEIPNATDGDEVGDAIANVLAPYRDEQGTSGVRRFSREYALTETSTSRKSSRASI